MAVCSGCGRPHLMGRYDLGARSYALTVKGRAGAALLRLSRKASKKTEDEFYRT